VFPRIYKLIEHDNGAVYQIKVKGKISDSLAQLLTKAVRISIETADSANPITMLTRTVDSQLDLINMLRLLHSNQYPIISVVCVDVLTEVNA
jgi:hypothetical protein